MPPKVSTRFPAATVFASRFKVAMIALSPSFEGLARDR
jgi:hypothetical protein